MCFFKSHFSRLDISKLNGKIGLLLIAALNISLPAFAQNTPFGECRTGYWSSNRNLDDATSITKASCFINWRTELNEHNRIVFNARTGIHDQGLAQTQHIQLREAFLESDIAQLNLRLGRQIIAWGRADRINPTDYFSPRDFTVLAIEDEEQRSGINAAVLRYISQDAYNVSAVVTQFEAHRLPKNSLTSSSLQHKSTNAPEWGMKIDRIGEGVDWSVSYFNGYEKFPRYRIDLNQLRTSNSIRLLHDYEKIQSIGSDFALAKEEWTMRGEWSYSRSACSGCIQSERQVRRATIGADRNIGDSGNINIQIFSIFRDLALQANLPIMPNKINAHLNRLNSEFSEKEWGITLRMAQHFLNERLKLELSTIIDISNKSSIVRPRVSYAISDAVKLQLGIDYFRGEPDSYFGSRIKNKTGFIEMSLIY